MEKYGNYGFLNTEQLDGAPLQLLDFGREHREKEKYAFDNAHRDYDGYLFQYTLTGCGCYEKDGRLQLLPPGTAFFAHIPEEGRYYLPQTRGDETWEYLYVHFDGPAAGPFFQSVRSNYGVCVSLPADSFPIQLWLNLHADMGSGRQLRRYEGGELVYRFLSGLLRTLEAPGEPVLSARVEESILYMKEHLAEHFSIEDLALRQHLSCAYFTRLFTAQTGQSPQAYLTHLRLNRSLFLLLNTTMNVEEVASACGFSCGNYFCKVFRKASGFSPAEYRRRYGG